MELAIYGAGGLGREILELARQINTVSPKWGEILFVVDKDYYNPQKTIVNGARVFDFETFESMFPIKNIEFSIAQGEPVERERIANKLISKGYSFATLIHPGVHIPDSAKIGKGVVIQSNCFISCNTDIKDMTLVQINSAIGHDCCLKKGCVISPNCTLGGFSTVGQYSFLGMSCTVKERTTIGDFVVVGMGSSVFRDLDNETIALGNPARVLKKNENHRVFS